ncbi:MAG: nucleoside deaminase [Coriobacteriia bacterium]
MDHEFFMRRAIELSRASMRAGQGGPFAAVVVKDGAVVGEGWNQVTSHNDPTSHAEIVAIRAACATLGTFSLEGATIYTTCEPCPMCLAAIYWARLDRVFYANSTTDAAEIGFDDGRLYQEVALPPCDRELPCSPLLAHEARAVFNEWAAKPDKVEY